MSTPAQRFNTENDISDRL